MEKYFIDASEELISKYRKCGNSKHSPTVGAEREAILVSFLRDILPKRVGLCTGHAFYEDQQSKQVDIIAYDANATNGLPLGDGNNKLIPAENLLGIIEVKSKLTKTKLKEGINNIQSVIELKAHQVKKYFDLERKPFTIIFAYELERNSLDSLSSNLNDILAEMEKPKTLANLVCVLNKGLIHFDHELMPFEYLPFYNITKYKAFMYDEKTLYKMCQILKSYL